MISLRVRLALFFVVALLLWLYVELNKYAKQIDQNITSTTLAKDDKERILIDEKKRTITVVKAPTGTSQSPTTRVYHLSTQTAIDFKKDGTVSVLSRSWGPEHAPFIGATYSDKLRLAVGVNLFYVNRFDLGVGLSTTFNDAKLFMHASYNLYSNTSLGLGCDHQGRVLGDITFRF